MKKVVELISQLPKDFEDCASIQGDIEKITSWGKKFENPEVLIDVVTVNTMTHLPKIISDIKKLKDDVVAGNWYAVGED